MEIEAATSPVEGGDNAAATPISDTGVETQVEGQLDDYGNPIEVQPEDEEIEIDPELKLKVPKDQAQKLKDAILRQADYTRKTQEVAEMKRATGETLQQLQTMNAQEFSARATLMTVDQQLAQYQNFNFSAALAQANANYDEDAKANIQAAFMEFQQLDKVRQNAIAQIGNAQQQRAFHEQQATAKQMEEGRAALAKAIPEWNDTHRANLVNYASQFGFSPQELGDLEADPRAARILHEAFKGAESRKTAAKVQGISAAQQVQPAAKVGGGSPPPAGLDDRLSVEEWTKRREKQLRSRS